MTLKNIVGRKEQIEILKQAVESPDAEFIAIYGRRRIGKTFLIKEYFESDICFEIIGIHSANLREQLENFSVSLGKALGIGFHIRQPDSWQEAFFQLEQFLESLKNKKTKGKKVVFIDELPWLNTPRSRFLSALEHFWNSYGSIQKNLILVVCGSAASWMIQNIVRSTGGLHHRLTRRIALYPFSLAETRDFLKSRKLTGLNNSMITHLYMVLGGVPYYLKLINPGLSAAQVIDELFFTETGQLRQEYELLYKSLFDNSDQHIKIVELLAKFGKGLSRDEILNKSNFKSGGSISRVLEELEESGFIESRVPFGKKTNDLIYVVSDELTLFHLHWIKPLGKKSPGKGYWLARQNSQEYRIWSGFGFESICRKNVPKLKEKLGISSIECVASPWRYKAKKVTGESGAQIDLLLDRKDGVINMCEMKFHNDEFVVDAQYAKELKRKIRIFQEQTLSRKSIFLTMVTSYGIKRNSYADELELIDIKLDDLF